MEAGRRSYQFRFMLMEKMWYEFLGSSSAFCAFLSYQKRSHSALFQKRRPELTNRSWERFVLGHGHQSIKEVISRNCKTFNKIKNLNKSFIYFDDLELPLL